MSRCCHMNNGVNLFFADQIMNKIVGSNITLHRIRLAVLSVMFYAHGKDIIYFIDYFFSENTINY